MNGHHVERLRVPQDGDPLTVEDMVIALTHKLNEVIDLVNGGQPSGTEGNLFITGRMEWRVRANEAVKQELSRPWYSGMFGR